MARVCTRPHPATGTTRRTARARCAGRTRPCTALCPCMASPCSLYQPKHKFSKISIYFSWIKTVVCWWLWNQQIDVKKHFDCKCFERYCHHDILLALCSKSYVSVCMQLHRLMALQLQDLLVDYINWMSPKACNVWSVRFFFCKKLAKSFTHLANRLTAAYAILRNLSIMYCVVPCYKSLSYLV